jgi:hypothetical protein
MYISHQIFNVIGLQKATRGEQSNHPERQQDQRTLLQNPRNPSVPQSLPSRSCRRGKKLGPR